MDTNIWMGAEAGTPNDILLGYGLAFLPRDDKPRRVRHPLFRRPPEKPAIVAWSLFQSLVEQHGISKALRVYSAMEAERKGPFQPGAKYDPDLEKSPPFVAPEIVVPGKSRGSLMPFVVSRRRKGRVRVVLPPRMED